MLGLFSPDLATTLTTLPPSLRLCVPDQLVGLLASLLTSASFLVIALAHRGSTYVFAGCLGLLGPMVSSVARSLLSKQVHSSRNLSF